MLRLSMNYVPLLITLAVLAVMENRPTAQAPAIGGASCARLSVSATCSATILVSVPSAAGSALLVTLQTRACRVPTIQSNL